MNTKISDSNVIELKNLWNNGKTLEESFIYYASKEIARKYKKAKNELDKWNEASIEERAETIEFAYELTLGLKPEEIQINFNNAKENAAKDILNKLITSKLMGTGYLRPKSLSITPQSIPAYIWPINFSDIDWDKSEFSNEEFEFWNIRIIDYVELGGNESHVINKIDEAIPDVEDKKLGRPPMGPMLHEIFDSIESDGLLDSTKNLSSYTELIQQRAELIDSTLKAGSPSYKTICKHLSKRFEVYKNSL